MSRKVFNRSVVGGALTGLLIFTGLLLLPYINAPLEAATAANQKEYYAPEFDHSDCQYPYRWSNPVDGCDNSDPAVPECIKGAITEEAERTCIAEYVRQYEAQGQEQVNTPPQTSTPPANACGGK